MSRHSQNTHAAYAHQPAKDAQTYHHNDNSSKNNVILPLQTLNVSGKEAAEEESRQRIY